MNRECGFDECVIARIWSYGASYRAIILIGLLTVSVGCQEQGVPAQNQQGHATPVQKQDHKDYAMTEKLRQQYITAKTRQDWLKAKDEWVTDLKTRYAGIDASVMGPPAAENDARFSRLMREWNPIHCSVQDLKSVAGNPTSETADSLEYIFDNGLEASGWRFTISAGDIQGLQYIPGD